jgi:PAS domain S-box-containing protein
MLRKPDFFRQRHFHHDLGWQLLALYLMLVLPVLTAIFIFDQVAGRQIQAEVKAGDLSLARAIAKEADHLILNALDAVQALGAYPAVRTSDPQGMEAIFSIVSATRPDVNLVYRLDAKGIMFFHYPVGPGTTVGTDFSFRNYFQRALESDQPLLSEGRISPTTQQPVATAVMPIRSPDGIFDGVVATNIRLESLSATLREILAEHASEERFEIFIIDHTGQIIAHPSQTELLKSVEEIMPRLAQSALKGVTGSETVRGLDREEYLTTYAPIPSAGWSVIIRRPVAAAFSQQILYHNISLGAIGIFTLIGLLFWLVLSRRVISPVEKLASISQKIGANQSIEPADRQFLENAGQRSDQIGNLITSLLRMEQSIMERMNEQSTLLETSQAVVSSLDSQIVLNRILEQVERLMNVEKVALVALDEKQGVFRVRASRGLSTLYAEQMTIQPDEPNSVTMRAIRMGEPIQVSDTETDGTFTIQRPRARAEGYRSVLAVPLKTQYTPPSALLVYRPDPHEYSENEIRLVVSFANHATMAIENAALYTRSDMRLTEQTRRIEALIQSMQDGLILGDLRGNVVYANRRISELADLTASELRGTPVTRVMARILSRATGPENAREKVENALFEKNPAQMEFVVTMGGRHIALRLQIFDVNDPRGVSIGQGLILQDVTVDREVDRMKSSLISTVSHELRTPLASIKGYATTLLADDVEWDRNSQREFLEIISSESDRLSELVNNLLDLSRIEAGSLVLQYEECNIRDLIRRAAARGHLEISNQFTMQIDAGLSSLWADPLRMETILRNLIENAAKYAGSNAKIHVRVGRTGGNIIFRVEDNGPGIATEQSTLIFQPFYRLDESLSRASGGAGLGLTICQGFVRAHGGEIWVEPQDKGACIAFSVPMRVE